MVSRRDLESQLKLLSAAGEKAKGTMPKSFRDEASGMSAEKREGWARFLCSIATTESVEDQLIEPIRETFADSKPIMEYLDSQGEDERRHFQLFTDYVKHTFHYEKKHRSFSDVAVYGTLLPTFSKLGRSRPIYLLAALRFYEAFSLDFYKVLKKLAVDDGLTDLVSLIQAVEKDELRHLSGLEALLAEHRRLRGVPGKIDVLAIRSLLGVLLADINIGPWALHNRRVRRNSIAIGLDPVQMNRDARKAAEDSLRFVTGKKRRKA